MKMIDDDDINLICEGIFEVRENRDDMMCSDLLFNISLVSCSHTDLAVDLLLKHNSFCPSMTLLPA